MTELHLFLLKHVIADTSEFKSEFLNSCTWPEVFRRLLKFLKSSDTPVHRLFKGTDLIDSFKSLKTREYDQLDVDHKLVLLKFLLDEFLECRYFKEQLSESLQNVKELKKEKNQLTLQEKSHKKQVLQKEKETKKKAKENPDSLEKKNLSRQETLKLNRQQTAEQKSLLQREKQLKIVQQKEEKIQEQLDEAAVYLRCSELGQDRDFNICRIFRGELIRKPLWFRISREEGQNKRS
eukprot:TRINITY_DN1890_c0_g2_i7.p2 TRINITY_DN1890_c0_g2~~TRINITY_DN1890_c0_g2_i7.p2  ORF type:complete len:250 (+),score=52.47 TRINITY_DN1890_c0_g2_i7:45-752(+)